MQKIRKTSKKNLPVDAVVRTQLIKLINKDGKRRMKWTDAVERFVKETKNKDAVNQASIFKTSNQYLGKLYLDQIDRHVINHIIESRLDQGVSNTTVNRLLQKIRAVLNKAHKEWEVKCDPPYIKMLKEPRLRIRWLTKNEKHRLMAALPEHLKLMAELSLETGLRESNVTLLRWDQIDMAQRIIYIQDHDILKGEKPYIVPLSDKAMRVLFKARGQHKVRVFTYKGKPIRRANGKAFRKALIRADIENFRWHDFRHTWATWHVQKGTPLEVLQELGGWTDFKMVKRYAHFDHSYLHQYVK
ncbi:MAG: site-specific integrase [Thiomicrospira sp.]|nr:MAG: site-specific integrase [Thiomicrospira sp.]